MVAYSVRLDLFFPTSSYLSLCHIFVLPSPIFVFFSLSFFLSASADNLAKTDSAKRAVGELRLFSFEDEKVLGEPFLTLLRGSLSASNACNSFDKQDPLVIKILEDASLCRCLFVSSNCIQSE